MKSCPHCSSPYSQPVEFCGIDGTRLVDREHDQLIGADIDRFRILEHIGDGGMARVYRVRHHVLDREFAMKVLFGEYAANKTIAQRFKREAQTISKIDHPNVVSVADFGRTPEGLTFLTMELVRGSTLRHLVKTYGAMDTPRVAAIARQLAEGLRAAHELGFVHRDLKPGNVMLVGQAPNELVKILDFGLARMADSESDELFLTRTGQFLGTPIYMAPEQIIGADVDHRADLYALGVVMYEMLEGRPPFKAKKLAEIRQKHLVERPPSMCQAGGLETIVTALLAKSAAERPESARQIVARIDALSLDETKSSTALTVGAFSPIDAREKTVQTAMPAATLEREEETRRMELEVAAVAKADAVAPAPADPDATRPSIEMPSRSAEDPEPWFEPVGPTAVSSARDIPPTSASAQEGASGAELRLDSSIVALDDSRVDRLTPATSRRPVVAIVAGLSVGAAVALGIWLTRAASNTPAAHPVELAKAPPASPPPTPTKRTTPPPQKKAKLVATSPPPKVAPPPKRRKRSTKPTKPTKRQRTRQRRKLDASIDAAIAKRGLMRSDVERAAKSAWQRWRTARQSDDLASWTTSSKALLDAIDGITIDSKTVDVRLGAVSRRLGKAAKTLDAETIRPFEDEYLELVGEVRPNLTAAQSKKLLVRANALLQKIRRAER